MKARNAIFAVFFFAGHFARTVIPRVLSAPRWALATASLVALAFTGVSLTLTASAGRHALEFAPLTIPFVLVSIAVSVRLAHALDRRAAATAPVRWISWVGRNSVVFYLTHVPLMLVVCALARHTVGDLGLWIVGVCFAIALGGGIPLALANRHPSVSWLFRAPGLGKADARRALEVPA
ncbi:acyltransferase family protein [Microbacterium sp.]|uniref:acyltransferase family protein n=1 Tax=Microbacterium sp. TaxID=51671 RepID=UPI0037357412